MSAASPARLTAGYSAIPNSLIENQAALTHAELALALIIFRRGWDSKTRTWNPIRVSDHNWQDWTQLHPRSKELAIAGLRKKGLSIEGRGDRSQFHIDHRAWEGYVTSRPRTEKPRTEKKPVDPKPGAKIHQECQDRGCQILRDGEYQAKQLLTLVPATRIAKPVSQTAEQGRDEVAHQVSPPTAGKSRTKNDSSRLFATPIAQPVSRSTDAAEQIWAAALEKLRGIFPLAGVVFLMRLVAVCRVLFHDLTDQELAVAIETAWQHKKRTQDGEGLFIYTVPEAIAALRRRPPLKPGREAPDHHDGARMLLARIRAGIEARGAPLTQHLDDVQKLTVALGHTSPLEQVEAWMEQLEAHLLATARRTLNDGERQAVAESVEKEFAHWAGRSMTADQRDRLRRQLEAAEIFTVLGIPRPSQWHSV